MKNGNFLWNFKEEYFSIFVLRKNIFQLGRMVYPYVCNMSAENVFVQNSKDA